MKTLSELINGLDVLAVSGRLDTPVAGVCYDSRQVEKDSLFVCVRGSRSDGHEFIGGALSRGAVAIIAEVEVPAGFPAVFVRVRDSRAALAAIAANFYDHPAARLELIGITGTNGKTTTSLLIESILRCAGHSPGVLGTLAYRWSGRQVPAPMTTPESLDLQRILYGMLRDGVSHVVMEVSSHALALGRVSGCAFRAGVFTNLSQDHLDFHETMEDYFAAKKLLFSCYFDPRLSAAVVNADDAYGKRLIENGACGTRVFGFSAEEVECGKKIRPGPPLEKESERPSEERVEHRVFAENVRFSPEGITAKVQAPQEEIEIESSLVGRLNLYNILAAVSTALALDIPSRAIKEGIRAVSHVDGRLQSVAVPAGRGFQVIVDYAHTPDAMEKALACLREMTSKRIIAVFGCGGDRDRGKRPIMGRVAAQRADLVIITSDNPRTEVPEEILDGIEAGVKETTLARFDPSGPPPDARCYTRESDRRRAIRLALSLARPGDIVFIGGKGHETYQIIGTTRHPFDDRLVVKEYFSATGLD
ncbi:MAG: UDP-N-acetylmuramoyl-L-alanyl-D-glutamate--2,6-diaminopimelate ligase [Syntrophobacteraceae bacterium]